VDCIPLGGLVEMKIHYRKTSLLEEMQEAITKSKDPIDHFELTQDEFNQHFSSFDKSFQRDNSVQYMFRGIPLKVNNEN
jgi:hypothetical protein